MALQKASIKTKAYFNGTGYTISGPDVCLVVKLNPLTDKNGPIFSDREHLYRVLLALLKEITHVNSSAIYIYNDSSIIDEMNGIRPIDEWGGTIVRYIHRNIMPKIQSIVYFNKESISRINHEILRAEELLSLNEPKRQGKMANYISLSQESRKTHRRTRVTSFKQTWFNRPGTA